MAKKRPAHKRGSAPKVSVPQTQERQQLLFRISITALLLSVYGFYLAHQVNLTVGDLGRHLKNGQLFIENGLIPKINLYSYAYPDYPFINHHWGSGVLFYLIQRLAGFSGLSVAFIIISMVTFLIFINVATKYCVFCNSRADSRHRSSGFDHSVRGETRVVQLFVLRSVSSTLVGLQIWQARLPLAFHFANPRDILGQSAHLFLYRRFPDSGLSLRIAGGFSYFGKSSRTSATRSKDWPLFCF